MRVRVLAILATALAIAACNDAPAPTALNSTDGGTAVAPEAHFNGHNNDHDRGRKSECRDERGHHHGWWGRHVFKRGRHWYYYDRHHHLVKVDPRELSHRHKCDDGNGGGDNGGGDNGGGDNGGGGETPGSVDGTVRNEGAGAVAYAVFLLSPDGGTVTAQGATDGTGTFNFAGVTAGSYLLCEAVPPEPLSQTRPQQQDADHPACPATYAPLGFLVTVTAGTASTGFAFANMQVN